MIQEYKYTITAEGGGDRIRIASILQFAHKHRVTATRSPL